MRWILISSGIRDVQWGTEDKIPGGEKEAKSVLHRECFRGNRELQFTLRQTIDVIFHFIS